MLDALIAAVLIQIDGHDNNIASRTHSYAVERAAAVMQPAFQAWSKCVVNRESHGNPRAVNPGSGAAGIAQFMPDWRHGGPYIVQRALRAHGATVDYARKIRLNLPYRIEHWPERYQRILFAQVIDEGGHSAAMRHWNGGGGCNGLLP